MKLSEVFRTRPRPEQSFSLDDLETVPTEPLEPLFDLVRRGLFQRPYGPLPGQCIVEYDWVKAFGSVYGQNDYVPTNPDHAIGRRQEKGPRVADAVGQRQWPTFVESVIEELDELVSRQFFPDYDSGDSKQQERNVAFWGELRKVGRLLSRESHTANDEKVMEIHGDAGRILLNSMGSHIGKIVIRTALLQPDSCLLGDLVLRAVDAGAWPCGWRGQYPNGALVVLWPFPDEPTFMEE